MDGGFRGRDRDGGIPVWKDVNGISCINANLPARVHSPADKRPRWTSAHQSKHHDRVVMGSENSGYSSIGSASLRHVRRRSRPLAYACGVSKNTMFGSIASGSWTGNQISLDPNNPAVSYTSTLDTACSDDDIAPESLCVGATTFSLFNSIPQRLSYITRAT